MSKKRLLEFTKIIGLYALIAFIFLSGTLFSKGVILGGDWVQVATKYQAHKFISDAFFSWTSVFTFTGKYQSYLTDLPLALFVGVVTALGLVGAWSKILLFGVYVFGAYSMYVLLRYLSCARLSAFIGGLIYITSPFFFNYSVMGWINVLISLSILPLFIVFFDISVKENKKRYALVCGILYSCAVIQSTSLVWYALVLFAFFPTYLKDKKVFLRYLFYAFIVFAFMVLTNSFWIFNLFAFDDPIISGSGNVLSGISLGTWRHLSFWNIVRGWGSLFNYSYEASYLGFLHFLSFVLFVLFLVSLFVIKKINISKFTLLILYIFPFVLYFLGPHKIAQIPFSNVIRDVARMLVLVSFCLAVFSSLLIDFIYKKKIYWLFGTVTFLVFLNMNPYWTGQLWGSQKVSFDIRLRTYEFPDDIKKVEKYLFENKNSNKILYVPLSSSVMDFKNPDYTGDYHEMAYLFAGRSPMQGGIFTMDKESEGINKYNYQLMHSLKTNFEEKVERILSSHNIEFVVFYFDYMSPSDWDVYASFMSYSNAEDITSAVLGNSSDYVALFKILSPSAEIEVSKNIVYTNFSDAFDLDEFDIDELTQYSSVYSEAPLKNNQVLAFEKQYPGLYENLLQPNDGWVWPTVNHAPDTLAHLLVRLKEILTETLSLNPLAKADAILWDMSKRVAEAETFENVDLWGVEEKYAKSYKRLIKILSSIPEEKQNDAFFGLLKKVYYYTNYANGLGIIKGNFDEYKKWLSEMFPTVCEDACFVMKAKKEGNYSFKSSGGVIGTVYTEKGKFPYVENSFLALKAGDYLGIKFIPYEDEEYYWSKSVAKYIFEPNVFARHQEALQNYLFTNRIQFYPISRQNTAYWTLDNVDSDAEYAVSIRYPREWDQKFWVIVTNDEEVISQEYVSGAKQENITLGEKVLTLRPAVASTKEEGFYTFIKRFGTHFGARSINVYVITSQAFENGPDFVEEVTIKHLYPEGIYLFPEDYILNNERIPTLRFKKINQTKYKIDATNISGPFNIMLKQRYNNEWKLFKDTNSRNGIFETIGLPHFDDTDHFLVDGYANGWHIDPQKYEVGESASFVVEFIPQRYTYIGFFIAISTYLFAFVYILSGFFAHRKAFEK